MVMSVIINNLPASAILPTVDDCLRIRNNYIILAARVIAQNLSHFLFLQKCVVQYISHKFSKETAKKSVIVSHVIYKVYNYLTHWLV